MTRVHATAVVEEGARLAGDVEVGPFCFVGRKVRLGAAVRLGPHVVVLGDTDIGERTIVHSHAVLGGPAQFRADDAPDATLRIGMDNIIREHVTMNGGSARGGGLTRVGNGGYFMAYSHVAHDCQVGNDVTFANGAQLAGHVTVADGVTIGGLAAVLQFVRIGRNAFIGGSTGLPADVIPYGLVQGSRAVMEGLNIVGLKRKGVPRERIHALRAAYRFLFLEGGAFADRVREAADKWPDSPEVGEVLAFINADSKRPICMAATNAKAADS
jgi:UDP-N-acetylglucosamine acyltransferase